MTQPTQNSGHKWVMDYPNVPLGHCMCGYGRTFGENGIDPEQYAAHVASVAQPQEVPAEQRDLRIQVEHEISNRLATLLLAKEVDGSGFDFISAVKLLARELDHTVQPESPNADIPESKRTMTLTHTGADSKLNDPHMGTTAAKPAEDGLEAQCEKLAEYALRNLESNSQSQLEYNVSSAFADFIAARERELREKLERLAVQLRERAVQSREEAGRIRRTVYVATDAESNCMVRAELWDNLDAELRALLASHWPAPAPEEHVCHDCERMVSNETRPAEPPASKGGKA